MIGTFLGIGIALALYFNPALANETLNLNYLAVVFVAISTLMLLIQNLALALAWSPLQKAEQNLTGHLLNLFKRDRRLRLATGWILFFALATYYIAINIAALSRENQNLYLALWIIFFGFTIDTLQNYLRRILSYLNPFSAVKMFTIEGQKCIREDRDVDLCDWLDAITEVALKGIGRENYSLSNFALNQSQILIGAFLESSKSIGHPEKDEQTKALGIQDKISYTLLYLFQRLELVNEKAVAEGLEMISGSAVTTMGKITLQAAKYDLSLTIHPLFYLGKFTDKALEKNMLDVGVRASIILLEISKSILAEIDITYLEIQETFLSIIGHLERIAKESFKRDKSLKIAILLQPFLTMKELFRQEKAANHQDTAVILRDLDRIILEFQTLEQVMRTMPPMASITPESLSPNFGSELPKIDKTAGGKA